MPKIRLDVRGQAYCLLLISQRQGAKTPRFLGFEPQRHDTKITKITKDFMGLNQRVRRDHRGFYGHKQ